MLRGSTSRQHPTKGTKTREFTPPIKQCKKNFHVVDNRRTATKVYQKVQFTCTLRVLCFNYSGTPPYDHPVYKTTSLLRPYSFKPNVKNIDSFYYLEDPVNATTSLLRPGFYGPTVVVLTGFHCIKLYLT